MFMKIRTIGPALTILCQIPLFAAALIIACYRYVSIRRYL